jgi:hypothetical protein
MVLFSEGDAGEVWKPSNKTIPLENRFFLRLNISKYGKWPLFSILSLSSVYEVISTILLRIIMNQY